MKSKNNLFYLILAILVFLLIITGCTPPESKDENAYLIFEIREDYREYLYITKSGYVEHSVFSDPIFYKFSSGTLSEEEMKELSEFVENSGFFKLRNAYPLITYPLYKLLFHSEHYRISVKRNGKMKSVYLYGGDSPDAFMSILVYLREKIEPQLQNDPRYGVFIIAEKFRDAKHPNILSDKDLETNSFLAQAILNPGRLIYIESLENSELEDYVNPGVKGFLVTIKGNAYLIDIFEREE